MASKVMSGGWQLHFTFEKTRIRFLNWKIASITDFFCTVGGGRTTRSLHCHLKCATSVPFGPDERTNEILLPLW